MKDAIKFLGLCIIVCSLVIARENTRSSIKQLKDNYYIVQDDSQDNEDNKLDRKRSHKRRRKIRKPVKGLR